MTSISPKDFTDEHDNIRAIGYAMEKEQYKKIFIYLYEFFKKWSSVTAKDLQTKYFILEYSRAFQLMQSLVVLNLLKKIKEKGRKQMLFVQINPNFWEEAKKELDKKESENGSNWTSWKV